ncbi:HTH domain-containing protein [Streptococcus constellatus subsp. pharyngis]|uniref:HTH domain protein n=1 Tax=Streptococcus constellatus subsp. pharyngis SK1060 = CCUG 46377 TaxID=1035184 RepID=F9P6Z7_STRCV|nr:HTH domain-containing protein [Streptococcus constellatus]QBX07042.1 hypothetical protein JavanS103_0018 [Streptococcus satellite phage Javan103]AGU80363.1 hypothetical protein SCI_1441 [Streptococcus constellatus subsp. pharyngis C1050]EGV08171.1 HTH domain protein [Streptococcus constellatus subsp. pharyngis SK1060 = CCUG 46377]KXU02859.1 hypothetical protein SCODD09_00103 [Streptococcus constellatus]QQC22845.1 HTH domain-containing protein [Streptococcus constellatus]
MGAFSIEFEQGLLERVDKLANKKLELERQLQNKTGLISAKELKNELDISGTTLNNWIKQGLEVYQSPFESSKKQYFRVSDVIKFLTVY